MNPFDSLPARVKVRAMVGYLLSAAAVLWAPLLWGGASPWRHIGWLVPALAVVWFGGALVLGRGAAAELGDPHHDGAFRRLRRQLLWSVLRVATSALLVGLYVLALVVGPKSVADDQRLIDQQPHRSATIVTVTQVWLGHTPSWDVDVLVDGRTSRLALEPAGVSHAKAGDAIEVVVDPADPSYVIPTSAHDDWIYSTRGTVPLDAVMGVLVLVVIASLLWGAMPPRLFRSATQIRTTHRGRVVAAGYAGLTIEVGGRALAVDEGTPHGRPAAGRWHRRAARAGAGGQSRVPRRPAHAMAGRASDAGGVETPAAGSLYGKPVHQRRCALDDESARRPLVVRRSSSRPSRRPPGGPA